MPKYIFRCDACGSEAERITGSKVEELKCAKPDCGNKMKRQFPKVGSQVTTEIVDPYTNVRQTADHKQEVKQRKEDHFWEHEVPRLVEKYSTQTCLEEGWLVYNDKGELVINKPPSKR